MFSLGFVCGRVAIGTGRAEAVVCTQPSRFAAHPRKVQRQEWEQTAHMPPCTKAAVCLCMWGALGGVCAAGKPWAACVRLETRTERERTQTKTTERRGVCPSAPPPGRCEALCSHVSALDILHQPN